jgi:monoterpene epsilon-lactone hydrolase
VTDDREQPAANVLSLPAAPDAIELRHLRAFVAVAEELNFGRAAARLFLSQPALSRQIRALERLVGPDLLRRSTHRVELTLAGEALLDRARVLLRDLDHAVSATRSVGGELAQRIERLWQPVDSLAGEGDLQDVRAACETLHAQLPVPPDIDIAPVNAGGVPSLRLMPQPDRPVTMLYLHGGGYATGSAFGYRHLAGAVAAAADCGVLLPEYRLAPEYPFPAAVDDARRAYLWMIDNGTDPAAVTVTGDSSGGGLVVSLLISLKQIDAPLPRCAVLFCPWIDLSCTIQKAAPGDAQPLLTLEQARRTAAIYLNGHSLDDPVVYPLIADLTGLPPLLIQAGTGDALLEDAHQLTDRARAHGVNARLELYPIGTHDFHLFWSFLPEAGDALEQAGRFVRDTRGTGRPDRRARSGAVG